MTTYDLIMLDPSGDLFMIEHRPNGRIFSSIALTQDEADGDFTDMHYEEELNAEAYALDICSQDLESDEPMGDRFRVIRTAYNGPGRTEGRNQMTDHEKKALNEFMLLTRSLLIELWDLARPDSPVRVDHARIVRQIDRLADLRHKFIGD